jgi:uncharacterized membrane protein
MTDYPQPGDQPSPAQGYQPPGQGYQQPGQGYQQPGYQPQGQGPGYQQQWPGYQAPAPGYGPPVPQKVRPGRVWYLLALALFAAGVAWLIVGIMSVVSTVNDLQRVPLPAGGTVSLSHSGSYTIYYEGPGAQSGDIPSFHIRVAPASSGAAVSGLTQYGATVTYHIGSHQGRAVFTLHVTSPGRFAVTTAGAPAAGADLAIGGSIGSGIVSALLPAIPLIILGLLGGLLVLVIRIVRGRSLRRGYP